MNQVTPYLMESADEAARLETKTDAALSERLLRLVGLEPGMRALDAGAGTGAVSRVMSRMVGPRGAVVGVDRSEERLAVGRAHARELGLGNLTFLAADIEAGPLAGGPYDFIWCRFVLEYLADSERALEHLHQSLRVGGKLVVGDCDGHGTQHYPMDPVVERGLSRVFQVLDGQFDPYAGRKLYHRFKKLGLADVKVHVEPYHLYAGTAPDAAIENWEQKLRMVRPRLSRTPEDAAEFEDFARRFLAMLRDENVFTYSVLLLAEGRRLR